MRFGTQQANFDMAPHLSSKFFHALRGALVRTNEKTPS